MEERRTGTDEDVLERDDVGARVEAADVDGRDAAGGESAALGDPAAGDVADGPNGGLARLQSEIQTLNDRHLRLAAEFDNYRKRVERERAEVRIRAQAELVGKLLEPLDDLQRVVDVEAAGAESVVEGSRLVERKLRQALESAGLEALDAEGQLFDPEMMEALATVPTDDPAEDDVVADVFQRGYRYHGVLVRPARVRVKKHG